MSNKPKVVFSLQNSDGVDIIWATDDGKWHAPYGFEGPGQGSELPDDVMRKYVYDTNDSGVVDLAEGLTPDAKVDWDQVINTPDFTVSWDNIISIPDSLVHQPDLDLVIQEVNSQFRVMDDEISSKVASSDFQLSISKINSEINSVRESKRDYFNSVDYYTSDKDKFRLTSWFYQGSPSASTGPTINWRTNAQRDEHLGDFYFDILDKRLYSYTKSGSNYSWVEYSHQTVDGIADALVVHTIASDTIDALEDNHRTSFRSTPTTPYKSGDLWMNDGVVMISAYSREEGEFNSNDWTVATDTYDPSELEKMVDELYSQVSTMYDSSNVLDTSWIWSIKAGLLLSRDMMSLYRHTPEVRSSSQLSSTVLDAPTPFTNHVDRVLRLTSSSTTEDGFNLGIRFGNPNEIESLVEVNNDYNYRLSFWIKASDVENLTIVVDDYSEGGVEDTSNNAHKSKPLSYVNAGTNQWVLGVMYLVTKTDDLSNPSFKTQLYNTDGVNIANLSSDLSPIQYSQNLLRLAIRANATLPNATWELYSIRLDGLNPSVPYPSITELVTNRVKRSGVVEELRGYLSNVEQRITPDRIINVVTNSEVFASKFPLLAVLSKSSLGWTSELHKLYDSSNANDYLIGTGFDPEVELGSNANELTLSSVTYRRFNRTTNDKVLVTASRSNRKLPANLSTSIQTEVEIISDSPLVASGVTTRVDNTLFNPYITITNPEYESSSIYKEGILDIVIPSNTEVLNTVVLEDSSGNKVTIRYSFLVRLETEADLITTTSLIPISMYSDLDSSSPRVELLTPNGTSMYIKEDEQGNEVEVYPQMLPIEAHIYNTNISKWHIRFSDSDEWIELDLDKFTTSDYGLMPIESSSQTPQPDYSGYKSIIVDGNLRYLHPTYLKDPDWTSTTPSTEMTNYVLWFLRVTDTEGQISTVVVDITPNLADVVKSLRDTTAQLIISRDQILQSVEQIETLSGAITEEIETVSGTVSEVSQTVDNVTDRFESYIIENGEEIERIEGKFETRIDGFEQEYQRKYYREVNALPDNFFPVGGSGWSRYGNENENATFIIEDLDSSLVYTLKGEVEAIADSYYVSSISIGSVFYHQFDTEGEIVDIPLTEISPDSNGVITVDINNVGAVSVDGISFTSPVTLEDDMIDYRSNFRYDAPTNTLYMGNSENDIEMFLKNDSLTFRSKDTGAESQFSHEGMYNSKWTNDEHLIRSFNEDGISGTLWIDKGKDI